MSENPDWSKIGRILFVCHGNICRSTMAECIFSHLLEQAGIADQFEIDSAATSREELGNAIYPGARRELQRHDIPILPHFSRQITRDDLNHFDLILAMDHNNLRNLERLLGPSHKYHLLLDWSPSPRDIADPWFTDEFTATWNDILEGCQLLLQHLK